MNKLYTILWDGDQSDHDSLDDVWSVLKRDLVLSHWRVFRNADITKPLKLTRSNIEGGFKNGIKVLLVTSDFSTLVIEKDWLAVPH